VSRPGSTLRLCAALVGLQALGLAGIAVFYLVELAVATSDDRVRALVTAGLALAAAAGLALVARGLLRRRRWARSPALVTNLLVLPVAVGLLQGGRWYAGAPLLVWALAVLGLLFAPATAAALDED
jgi:O-antigen/teichoic acid export membrane protein